MMDENGEINADAAQAISSAANDPNKDEDEAVVFSPMPVGPDKPSNPFMNGQIKTLDGDLAGDEFAADAINYQALLEKVDKLLEKLKLDA
jgi:ankyrin repeat/BTB/POZ domain-containing protein 1